MRVCILPFIIWFYDCGITGRTLTRHSRAIQASANSDETTTVEEDNNRAWPGALAPAATLLTSIIAVARFAEPLAMTSVFPYLPEMIASFGVERKDVAKWAGATSAVFSLAQSLTAVPWGRASDRFGRKPVVMTGLLCTMICFLIWGVSTSLPMAITIRAIQGASNGNG
jgi:MFS family permease